MSVILGHCNDLCLLKKLVDISLFKKKEKTNIICKCLNMHNTVFKFSELKCIKFGDNYITIKNTQKLHCHV